MDIMFRIFTYPLCGHLSCDNFIFNGVVLHVNLSDMSFDVCLINNC